MNRSFVDTALDSKLDSLDGMEFSHRNLQYSTIIDVMIVWTKKAECSASGLSSACSVTSDTTFEIEGRIHLAIAETNEAFRLSGIDAELRLVHYYRDPSYVETTFARALYEL